MSVPKNSELALASKQSFFLVSLHNGTLLTRPFSNATEEENGSQKEKMKSIEIKSSNWHGFNFSQ